MWIREIRRVVGMREFFRVEEYCVREETFGEHAAGGYAEDLRREGGHLADCLACPKQGLHKAEELREGSEASGMTSADGVVLRPGALVGAAAHERQRKYFEHVFPRHARRGRHGRSRGIPEQRCAKLG